MSEKDHEELAEEIKEQTATITEFAQRAKEEFDVDHVKDLPGDLRSKYEEMAESAADAVEKAQQAESKVNELENRLDRVNNDGQDDEDEGTKAHKELVFGEYIRKDVDVRNASNERVQDLKSRMPDTQRKALNETVGPQGALLVDEDTTQEMIRDVTEISPIREHARVTTISSNSFSEPKRDNLVSSGWIDEGGLPSESTSDYDRVRYQVHNLGVLSKTSIDLIQDSFVDIESELRRDAVEELARAEGQAFVQGSGTDRPEGIQTNSDITEVTGNSAGSDAVDSLDFDELLADIKQEYVNDNTRWFFSRKTWKEILQLTDADNRPIIGPMSIDQEAARQIRGIPYVIAQDVEDTGSDGNRPIIFGDLSRGYRIVEKPQMYVLRDPYTNKPDVELLWIRRLDGGVRQPEAIRELKI